MADSYSGDLAAPGKAVRLMAGLQYLKYAFNEATESVIGVDISDACVDKGCRGHGCDGSTRVHVAGARSKNVSHGERKRRRPRSASD